MKDIHKGHRQKMKTRFLKTELDDFELHNVLELLLFYSIPQGDTNETAHLLMDTFGSFADVLDAPYEELIKVKGVGEHTASLLKLIPSVSRVYLDDKNSSGNVLNNHKEAGEYLVNKFIGRSYECIYMVCLDGKGKILFSDVISKSGTVNSCILSTRMVVEIAIRCNAVAVVLAHNHPTGFATPSADDISSTKTLKEQLEQLDIILLDHFIISTKEHISMYSWGML
ncbi:MAG: JAB domain-containing protein [Oscillospiraceae bacterium]